MKKLIDEYLPLFHFSETPVTEVNAPANVVYSSVLACDLGRSAIARFLFRLRRLPKCEMTVEGLQQIGFRLLAKHEDREIVFGLIGKFWTSSAGILPSPPGPSAQRSCSNSENLGQPLKNTTKCHG